MNRLAHKAFSEGFKKGLKEGRLIGHIEVLVEISYDQMRFHLFENYEDIFAGLGISEEKIARIMDYLPIRAGEWKYLSENEKAERKDELKEKLQKGWQLMDVEKIMVKKRVGIDEALKQANISAEDYEEYVHLMENRGKARKYMWK